MKRWFSLGAPENRSPMDITVQIVNYNSRNFIRNCLSSVGGAFKKVSGLEVILINNDEEKFVGAELEINLPFETGVVEVNRNVGFGKAHNIGAERARGKYIFFANPDTILPEGLLDGLFGLAESDDEIGIIGSALVNPEGFLAEEYCGSKKTPLSTFCGKLKRNEIAKNQKEAFEVDWVSGGAMLVRRDLFERLGRFDENYFMYFEDVDLCLQAKKAGHKVMADPRSKVIHRSGASFDSYQEKKRYYYKSQDHYLRKNFGSKQATIMKLLRLPLFVKNVYFSD